MTIDWVHFTGWASLAGGVLIGLAASFYVIFNGRIAGISGMLGVVLRTGIKAKEQFLFLVGLLLSAGLYRLFRPLPTIDFHAGPILLVVAGILVGVGTSMGSGCTSGHGVCGISRFSARSIVATLSFMAAGFVTVFVLRHLLAI